jgi:hypothetical protein
MKLFLLAVALVTAAIAGPAQTQLKYNPNQVAILRLYEANQTTSFFSAPGSVAFDGVDIWVASRAFESIEVDKMRASDGALLLSVFVGQPPAIAAGIAFDGANIWVSDAGDEPAVYKRRASDGMPLGIYHVGTQPQVVVFDGANIWATNTLSNNVTKLRACDGVVLGTFPAGHEPVAMALDGANIWVANKASNNLTKLQANNRGQPLHLPSGWRAVCCGL